MPNGAPPPLCVAGIQGVTALMRRQTNRKLCCIQSTCFLNRGTASQKLTFIKVHLTGTLRRKTLSHPSHTPLTPLLHPSHTPLTPLSHPSHTPLTLLLNPSHTPLTTLSHTSHIPLIHLSHTFQTPLTPLSQPSHTPLTSLSYTSHTPHTPGPLTHP